MDKPTDEQVKELWELCGFKYGDGLRYSLNFCWYPDGKMLGLNSLPIDLNNLFQYAVPKVNETHSIYLHIGKTLSTCVLSPYFNHPRKQSDEQHQDKDPTLALFWAIWEVIHNG